MRNINSFALAAMLAAVLAGGCRGQEAQAPAAQSQTQAVRPANEPTTVTGCLRSGDAENTFVLTTTETVDGHPAATYQLAGNAGVNLLDHVGKRVEVDGVISQRADIATRQATQPADKTAGTTGSGGTPTVQTGTELSINRLEVTSVKRAGGDCSQ